MRTVGVGSQLSSRTVDAELFEGTPEENEAAVPAIARSACDEMGILLEAWINTNVGSCLECLGEVESSK